jgi:signal peptidase II
MLYNEQIPLMGDSFKLLFVENAGMAFGMSWGGETGKLLLSLFRIAAIAFVVFYLVRLLRRPGTRTGLVVCLALILAGAFGNIIDSAFYGMIFNESTELSTAEFLPEGGGYAPFLHGNVVDMLQFELFTVTLPDWFPFYGNRVYTFFQPVFNLADAAITAGVIMILVWHKRYFRKGQKSAHGLPQEGTIMQPTLQAESASIEAQNRDATSS